ncbi:MAG TPA: TlpA disulfide reductase family protein [Vicinamibacteria bacterium]|nr:TlpA disulfide reductase family protein [Vicinamibacteria bacterium]
MPPSAASAQAAAAPPALAPGDSVAPFDAEGIDGRTRRIDFPKGGDTVLLFFLSGCPACHRMLPLWNQAYARRPKGLNVVGVLMDREPPGFFMATEIAFPVVRSPGGEFNRALKLNRVPLTLRVAPGGRVTDAAAGPIDALRLGEIFRP